MSGRFSIHSVAVGLGSDSWRLLAVVLIAVECSLMFLIAVGSRQQAVLIDGESRLRDGGHLDTLVVLVDGHIVMESSSLSRTERWVAEWIPDASSSGTHLIGLRGRSDGRGVSADFRLFVGPRRRQPIEAIDIVRPTDEGLRIEGWALDRDSAPDTGVSAVTLYLDTLSASGRLPGDVRTGNPRQDVAQMMGDSRFVQSGWWYDWALGGVAPGRHSLYAVASSAVTGERTAVRLSLDLPLRSPLFNPRLEAVLAPEHLLDAADVGEFIATEPRPGTFVLDASPVAMIGVASVGVVLAVTTVSLRIRRARLVLGASALVAYAFATIAFFGADPASMRPGIGHELVFALPHFGGSSFLQRMGLSGSIPASATSFAALPASLASFGVAALSAGRRRFAWYGGAGLAAVLVASSFERAPIAALLVAGCVWILLRLEHPRLAALLVIIAAVSVAVAVVLTDSDYGQSGRLSIWSRAIQFSLSNRLIPSFGAFGASDLGIYEAHNTFLEVLVDFGLLGLVLITALIAAWFAALLEGNRSTDDSRRLLVHLSAASLSALAIASMADSVLTVAIPLDRSVVTAVTPVIFVFLSLPLLSSRVAQPAVVVHSPAEQH